MARVPFASNEAPRPREKRIFAFTTSYRADSMASPLLREERHECGQGCAEHEQGEPPK